MYNLCIFLFDRLCMLACVCVCVTLVSRSCHVGLQSEYMAVSELVLMTRVNKGDNEAGIGILLLGLEAWLVLAVCQKLSYPADDPSCPPTNQFPPSFDPPFSPLLLFQSL